MARKTKLEKQFENELFSTRNKIEYIRNLYTIIKFNQGQPIDLTENDDEIYNALNAAYASVEQAIENL